MTKSPPAKAVNSRLYVVVETTAASEDEPASARPVALIRATTAPAALKHFVTPKYECRFAEQDDLYACAKAGIEPESSAAEAD